MTSFLITFKPSAESPERGWPLEDLQKLVHRFHRQGTAEDNWRFINRKDVSIGDRVFLLLQGKGGPAIIGYGAVIGRPYKDQGTWSASIRFDALTDPSKEVLATRDEVLAIDGAQRLWRSQASGVHIPDAIATALELLVVGKPAKPEGGSKGNPDWTRDELIVALDFYLKYRPNPPGKTTREIIELSDLLNRIGAKLFSTVNRASTFRNVSGVYMKLMNFRRLDPEYTAEGKKGLTRGAKADEEVWVEFAGAPDRCRKVAQAIIATLDEESVSSWESVIDGGVQEAAEGRLLTRTHLSRERNQALVETKRKQALKKFGCLACDACGFDFLVAYGERGKGFIECHHTKPLKTLLPGQTTHIDELALVCANCHRVIHRGKEWLTVTELRVLIRQAKAVSS